MFKKKEPVVIGKRHLKVAADNQPPKASEYFQRVMSMHNFAPSVSEPRSSQTNSVSTVLSSQRDSIVSDVGFDSGSFSTGKWVKVEQDDYNQNLVLMNPSPFNPHGP
jgi:hypothetical protein